MDLLGRRAGNASCEGSPVLVTAAVLVMGGCGGVTGSDTRVAPGARELGVSPADGALVVPVRRWGAEVPVAYYNLSFTLSNRTAGITLPVQPRTFAWMGLALYESRAGESSPQTAAFHGKSQGLVSRRTLQFAPSEGRAEAAPIQAVAIATDSRLHGAVSASDPRSPR
jgi:hypothetical protein